MDKSPRMGDGTYADCKPGKKWTRGAETVPVCDIPIVETKKTTFQGRLGYACLNTILRNKKPASSAIFCSRTCRSSEMFPFASHEIYGYSLTYCAPLLAQIGDLAKKYGHRLTMHPGQFTQLGSPRERVVQSSIRELKYHCEVLDLMGIGPDGVIVIHGGGVYGDKDATLTRIKKTIKNGLPRNVRDRLVLENDELCYTAGDLLPICKELEVPLVFDYHHDMLNPSAEFRPAEIIEQANRIFHGRGIKPKQHYSEPREGAISVMERRAHSDRCQALPEGLPDDMDLMIEAKDKEQAVFHLYRMYDLFPVDYESVRPSVGREKGKTPIG
ncbi:hypothetical protein ID866_1537 [Astraeus odoratus]|nr:hypothetical protein ID866_1537 [Astraeus odoratus]